MGYIFGLFSFVLGTIIGSFLNVVALRYNTGLSANGRSRCFSCGTTLIWYDLMPVISFVALIGRCRSCKSRLSLQYPLVELGTGALFFLTALRFGLNTSEWLPMLFYWLIFSLLMVIIVYDVRHTIIPDRFVFSFGLLALLWLIFTSPFSELLRLPLLWNLLAGPLFFLPFFLLWLLSRGRWMGLGDAKLALGIGWLLGFAPGISALILAFWSGALAGIILLVVDRYQSARMRREGALPALGRHVTMKSEIPFAPFLILGVILVFLFGIDVFGLGQLLL